MIKRQLAFIVMLGMSFYAHGMDDLFSQNMDTTHDDIQQDLRFTAQSLMSHVANLMDNEIVQEVNDLINDHGEKNVLISVGISKVFQVIVDYKISSALVHPSDIPTSLAFLSTMYAIQVTQEITPSLRHMTTDIGVGTMLGVRNAYDFLKGNLNVTTLVIR